MSAPLGLQVPLYLAVQDAILLIAVSGVGVHMFFKYTEMMNLLAHALLLLVLPGSLSYVLTPHYTVPNAVVLAYTIFYATLCGSIAVYRLSPMHPYYQYPGPVMCRLSRIWFAWVANSGKQHLYIQRLHEKYGDAVRIGPNEISLRDASVVNTIMGSQGLPKGPSWDGRSGHVQFKSLIAVRQTQEHLIRRKPWSRAFNIASIKDYQPSLSHRATQLTEVIGSQQGREIDLSKWIAYFTYDFMSDVVFSGGSEMMRDGDPDHVWERMQGFLDRLLVLEHLPWLAYYAGKIAGGNSPVSKFRKLAIKRVEARQEKGTSRKDLMYTLSNEDIGTQPPPNHTLLSEGVLAIIAGSDTTSSVLANIFYSLLRTPDVYKRLQAEVDKYFPPGEVAVDPIHFPEMTYLDAVINEGLRLYPAVPSGSQRAPAAGSQGKIAGPYFIPENFQVRLHIYSIHRDSRYFSEPNKFWPDRWLTAEGALPAPYGFVHNMDAFIPFSHGPMNCVGKQLAMHEMRTVLAQIMQKLELSFAPGWDPDSWERELEDRFVIKHGGLPVVVRTRY